MFVAEQTKYVKQQKYELRLLRRQQQQRGGSEDGGRRRKGTLSLATRSSSTCLQKRQFHSVPGPVRISATLISTQSRLAPSQTGRTDLVVKCLTNVKFMHNITHYRQVDIV